jgi:Flp pilus assembly protein TadG
MMMRGFIHRSAYAAALLAVALFSVASMQSIAMQASGATPGGMTMAICTSTGLAHVTVNHGVPADKSKTCPYCAVAAHAPLCASIASIPQSSVVAWTAYPALRPLGPRGPPARAPNARGPPPTVLTI